MVVEPMAPAVAAKGLCYRYPQAAFPALDDVSLEIGQGQIFGLLGPNGSGKTTLFRIFTALTDPLAGCISILGIDLALYQDHARSLIGVVFQNPSLDKKLTVEENLIAQSCLYGMPRRVAQSRINKWLERFGLGARRGDLAGDLSGGLARRVEVAKSLLHQPKVLFMDEPSTGLDPAVRISLWESLKDLADQDGVTIVMTTHLMEEAEKCGRLAILNLGRIVAHGSPAGLKDALGSEVIRIETSRPQELMEPVRNMFHVAPKIVNGSLHLECSDGHRMIPQVIEAFPGKISSVMVSKPTLEDVFIHYTGRSFDVRRET